MIVGYALAMTRDSVIKTLRAHRAALRELGVSRAALFGSIARGDDRDDSDIDLMVDVDPAAPVGVFEYVGIVQYLEALFPCQVDVANRAKLKPLVRQSVERGAVYAF
jgi:uncharacterized protein